MTIRVLSLSLALSQDLGVSEVAGRVAALTLAQDHSIDIQEAGQTGTLSLGFSNQIDVSGLASLFASIGLSVEQGVALAADGDVIALSVIYKVLAPYLNIQNPKLGGS